MREPLTPAQARVYEAIVEHVDTESVSPTLEELAEACGYKSLATVHEHVETLVEKGWVRRGRANANRSIQPTDTIELAQEEVDDIEEAIREAIDVTRSGMVETRLRRALAIIGRDRESSGRR